VPISPVVVFALVVEGVVLADGRPELQVGPGNRLQLVCQNRMAPRSSLTGIRTTKPSVVISVPEIQPDSPPTVPSKGLLPIRPNVPSFPAP